MLLDGSLASQARELADAVQSEMAHRNDDDLLIAAAHLIAAARLLESALGEDD